MKPTPSPVARLADPSWELLACRVQRGDEAAMQELYDIFSKGVRFMLFRQLGPEDLDDKVHDIFVIITEALRNGELREPSRLMGYVQTIVRRQIVSYIDKAVNVRRNRVEIDFDEAICDSRLDPENKAIERENEELAMRILHSIPKRDRDVLIRFYYLEESPEQICRALKLTPTQFRLIKSRSKARFGELDVAAWRPKAPKPENWFPCDPVGGIRPLPRWASP
jgi:RNA polymerase sigma factor (sigma-70 family)